MKDLNEADSRRLGHMLCGRPKRGVKSNLREGRSKARVELVLWSLALPARSTRVLQGGYDSG
jgi:hypothetical protein